MKNTFLLLAVICFNLLFSQQEDKNQEIYFPVKYVLKSSKDTIKTKVLNVGLYRNEEFSPATYIRQMTVLDPSGKKIKVKENDVKYMEIIDLEKVKRKFLNDPSILSKDVGLLEVMYNGKKTAWYRKSVYSGPIYTYKTDNTEYLFFRKDKSMIEMHFKIPGSILELKEKFRSYPDLSALIDEVVGDRDIIKILKLYDQK
ncbi:hypothetical protein SAMN05421664_2038 [Chryseobacterium soldanellicola]|uniref:Uncharacterized protein n=1 Tax=Chryseobacterium soldanellicola TaxID=311333 RepID=A0A1H1CPP1_9FLAO|nr:hypothetical protein [Chryseobacterium soldanellicola]SDQ65516.1 hypothetical protein SAMN05421664_2038 [Chryseobacterium soldanellicola]